MATGDTNDNVNRLVGALPPWFPTNLSGKPILTALLTGIADAFAFVYSTIDFAALQTRIKTATGGWLDLIAWDFFAGRFVRRYAETDTSWQPRILPEILRPRQTRAAIIQMLQDLTGRTPLVYEFFNPGDMGGYGVATMGGYGTGPGGYGSLLYPNQVFITAYRAPGQGIPGVGGYGSYYGGYRTGISMYGSSALISGPITDAEIYSRIAQTTAAGIIPWTALQSSVPPYLPKRMAILGNVNNTQYTAAIL